MSEKRFVIDEEGISDNKTDKWYCWKEEVVDLLNEQNQLIKNLEEENEELKEIHQKGSKSCEKWKQHKEAQIQQLEKENEVLQDQTGDYKER